MPSVAQAKDRKAYRRRNNGLGSITERPYNTLIPASPFSASSADLSSRTAKLSKPHWRIWLSWSRSTVRVSDVALAERDAQIA